MPEPTSSAQSQVRRYEVQLIVSRTYGYVTVEAEDELQAKEKAMDLQLDQLDTTGTDESWDVLSVDLA